MTTATTTVVQLTGEARERLHKLLFSVLEDKSEARAFYNNGREDYDGPYTQARFLAQHFEFKDLIEKVRECEDWQPAAKRYSLWLLFDEWQGHRDVSMQVYHREGLPDAVYCECIPLRMDWTDPYIRGQVDATFDSEEVAALTCWLASTLGARVEVRERKGAPDPNAIEWCLIPNNPFRAGHLELDELAGFPLDIKVGGFYFLRPAEGGPYPVAGVDRPQAAAEPPGRLVP
jgi:hypothetical protein